MSQPYVGEIRMFGGNFAPAGWALCDGRLLSIAENDVLFTLIGTTYGGDGQQTFALPDLRGRVPIHQGSTPQGQTVILGEHGGAEEVTLTVNQVPSHGHALRASTDIATQSSPSNQVLAQSSVAFQYIAVPPSSPLGATAMTPVGGSQPHNNFQPYLCISFVISLFGIFPPQS